MTMHHPIILILGYMPKQIKNVNPPVKISNPQFLSNSAAGKSTWGGSSWNRMWLKLQPTWKMACSKNVIFSVLRSLKAVERKHKLQSSRYLTIQICPVCGLRHREVISSVLCDWERRRRCHPRVFLTPSTTVHYYSMQISGTHRITVMFTSSLSMFKS